MNKGRGSGRTKLRSGETQEPRQRLLGAFPPLGLRSRRVNTVGTSRQRLADERRLRSVQWTAAGCFDDSLAGLGLEVAFAVSELVAFAFPSLLALSLPAEPVSERTAPASAPFA